MTRGYGNQHQKTDQLNAKKGKPDCHERIGLHMGHVDQRLTDAGNQDNYAQVVHDGASHANGRKHEHNGAKHWQIFDTVRVGSRPSPIPIRPLELIALE
jgi:hypothetical protein